MTYNLEREKRHTARASISLNILNAAGALAGENSEIMVAEASGNKKEPQQIFTSTFEKRIAETTDTDPEMASDLKLALAVTKAVEAAGGMALVVGGFARDDAFSKIKGELIASKDIDLEIYGIEFSHLKEILKSFGKVNITGDHFVIAKLRNNETGHDIDCSIPRRDSKPGVGHKGFVVDGDPFMSIEEAARRRDFTINSLAINPITGEVYDYFGGINDLQNGILRATDLRFFADDPLRVLRAMQFAGRFGMEVEPQTAELCKNIDLLELPKERIGEEWDKLMLKAPQPSIGLEVTRQLGILTKLHPDLAILDQIPQEPEWHPEGDVFEHTMLVVDAAARIVRQEGLDEEEAIVVMYAALCHDFGKATTTQWTQKESGQWRLTSYGHDAEGVESAKKFLEQVYQSKKTIAKVLPLVRGHMFHVNANEFSDSAIRRFAERLAPANIKLFNLVSRSDSNGRLREWQDATPSQVIYEKAVELGIAEGLPSRLIEARDFKDQWGLENTPLLGQIVRVVFELQMDGAFADRESAIAFLHQNKMTLLNEAQSRTAVMLAEQETREQARREQIERERAERKRIKQEVHLKRMAALRRAKEDS